MKRAAALSAIACGSLLFAAAASADDTRIEYLEHSPAVTVLDVTAQATENGTTFTLDLANGSAQPQTVFYRVKWVGNASPEISGEPWIRKVIDANASRLFQFSSPLTGNDYRVQLSFGHAFGAPAASN